MKQKTLFVAAAVAEAKAAAPRAPGSDHVWFSQALRDVGAERRRQVEAEGFDYSHDDAHDRGEMVKAAVSYGTHAFVTIELLARGEDPSRIAEMSREAMAPRTWPWDVRWWKPGNARRCLVKAAALIIAEIERLDRKAARHGE